MTPNSEDYNMGYNKAVEFFLKLIGKNLSLREVFDRLQKKLDNRKQAIQEASKN